VGGGHGHGNLQHQPKTAPKKGQQPKRFNTTVVGYYNNFTTQYNTCQIQECIIIMLPIAMAAKPLILDHSVSCCVTEGVMHKAKGWLLPTGLVEQAYCSLNGRSPSLKRCAPNIVTVVWHTPANAAPTARSMYAPAQTAWSGKFNLNYKKFIFGRW
jgi:hypothetical protein